MDMYLWLLLRLVYDVSSCRSECQFVCSMTSWSWSRSNPIQQLARHEESKALREQVLSECLGDLTNQRKVGVQKFPQISPTNSPQNVGIESDFGHMFDREIPQWWNTCSVRALLHGAIEENAWHLGSSKKDLQDWSSNFHAKTMI